jgi:ribonuclease P protein component
MQSGGKGLSRNFSLKHKSQIAALFDRTALENQTVAHGSVRLLFRFIPLPAEKPLPFQVAFASGKHKKAVSRNLVKRLLRANFQRHQMHLPQYPEQQLLLMVLYRGKAEEARLKIPTDLPIALKKISKPTI